MGRTRRYWLMKSEPTVFSIDDLRRSPNQTSCWDGVRNYQARNYLRDEITVGDGILFYHSSTEPIGVTGEAVVVRERYPDPTAFDAADVHYDPQSNPKHPRWYMVDVKFVRACKTIITPKRLRGISRLKKMVLLRRGSRLSVQPVTAEEWRVIMTLPEWEGSKRVVG